MKKILSLLLVLGMMLSIAACGTDPVTPADTTADPAASGDAGETTPAETTEDPLADNLPDVTYDGAKITVWVDAGGSQRFFPDTEITEDNQGDVVIEAVNERNAAVSDRFDVTLDYNVTFDGKWRDIGQFRQSILGGDPYDIAEGVTLYTCPLVTAGCFINLNSCDAINFEKAWWMPEFNEALEIMNRQYTACGFFEFPTIPRTQIITFNSIVAEDYEVPDLYELVKNKEWTIDKMFELAEMVADDLNQDGTVDPADQFGIVTQWDNVAGHAAASGYQYVTKGEDGSLSITGLNDDLISMHEDIFKMASGGASYIWSDGIYGKARTNHNTTIFLENRTLFWGNALASVESKLMREAGVHGILPPPMYLENQEKYGAFTSGYVCAIPVTTPDKETSSVILEALEAESYKILRPAYYDVALSYKYLNDPQSVEMLDIIFEGVTTDFTYNYAMAVPGTDMTAFSLAAGSQENLASYFATNSERFAIAVDTLANMVAQLPEE